MRAKLSILLACSHPSLPGLSRRGRRLRAGHIKILWYWDVVYLADLPEKYSFIRENLPRIILYGCERGAQQNASNCCGLNALVRLFQFSPKPAQLRVRGLATDGTGETVAHIYRVLSSSEAITFKAKRWLSSRRILPKAADLLSCIQN